MLPGQRRHLAVHGGRGVTLRGAVLGHGLQQGLGRVLFEQHGARAMAQCKSQHATQAKGEGNRRCAAHHIVVGHLQNMAWEQVAHGQHIAVKVQRALGLAGGAAGECDQAHIVAAAGVRFKMATVALRALLQAFCGGAAKFKHLLQTWRVVGVAHRHALAQPIGQ